MAIEFHNTRWERSSSWRGGHPIRLAFSSDEGDFFVHVDVFELIRLHGFLTAIIHDLACPGWPAEVLKQMKRDLSFEANPALKPRNGDDE